MVKKLNDYEKYERLNNGEVIDLLHDELPQNPDCECGDYYEHELSGIIFEIDYVHTEGANFCGCNWVVSERPDLSIIRHEKMIERDMVADDRAAPICSTPRVSNPFDNVASFDPRLGFGFGAV